MKKLCLYPAILAMVFSFSVINCNAVNSGVSLARDLVKSDPLYFVLLKKIDCGSYTAIAGTKVTSSNQSFTVKIQMGFMQFDYTLTERDNINATVSLPEKKVLDEAECLVRECNIRYGVLSHDAAANCIMLETPPFKYDSEVYKIRLHTEPINTTPASNCVKSLNQKIQTKRANDRMYTGKNEKNIYEVFVE